MAVAMPQQQGILGQLRQAAVQQLAPVVEAHDVARGSGQGSGELQPQQTPPNPPQGNADTSSQVPQQQQQPPNPPQGIAARCHSNSSSRSSHRSSRRHLQTQFHRMWTCKRSQSWEGR
eukprot:4000140-Amphidinium_carterae.1